MTFEFYDPQEKWPESESEFDICAEHLPATVMWKKEDGECPMCKLEPARLKIRKLKLERLMWKCSALAAAHFTVYRKARADRWHSLMQACKKELEKC